VQAIVSDIHANLAAFKAVLEDIEKHDVTRKICLGDVIGYGPNPKECLDLASEFDLALLGNHEQALMVEFDGATFNDRARGSLDWTRECLSMLSDDKEANASRWDFLGTLKETYTDGEVMYVHGSPRDPVTEYIYPEDLEQPGKLQAIFNLIDHLCFVGHSHVAGVYTEDGVFISPYEANFRYRLTNKKTIVNVGSVGQPRDGDRRASYVLFDGDTVRFRRIPYAVEETVDMIRSESALDDSLADRLQTGR